MLRPFYERAGRDLPTNLSVVLTGWRTAIQARLDADAAAVIALCKQHGVIEEGEAEPKRRRRGRKQAVPRPARPSKRQRLARPRRAIEVGRR